MVKKKKQKTPTSLRQALLQARKKERGKILKARAKEIIAREGKFRPIAAEIQRAALINQQANKARKVFDPMVSGAERAEVWAVTRNEISLLHNMEAQRNIAATPTRIEEDMADLAALELPD
jgi:hypothetical protein